MTVSFRNDVRLWSRQWQATGLTDVARLFDEAASRSRDDVTWARQAEFFAPIFHAAPGSRVLECGCGSGLMSAYLAQLKYQMFLLDFSDSALDLAKRTLDHNRLDGVPVQADVLKIPFASNSFDILMSYGLLEHFTDPGVVIREMVRVLKPDGVFVADIIPKRVSIQTLGDAINFVMRLIKRLSLGQWRHALSRSRRNFPFYENSLAIDAWRKLLADAGLEQVTVTGTRPFPQVGLPFGLERRLYTPLIKKLKGFQRRFDKSSSGLTDFLGCGWYAYARKPGTR